MQARCHSPEYFPLFARQCTAARFLDSLQPASPSQHTKLVSPNSACTLREKPRLDETGFYSSIGLEARQEVSGWLSCNQLRFLILCYSEGLWPRPLKKLVH